MREDDETERDFSRTEEIVNQLKSDHKRRGKFGLLAIFAATALAAAGLAIGKAYLGVEGLISVGYQTLLLLHLFAPLFSWAVVSLYVPYFSTRKRIVAMCAMAGVVLATFGIWSMFRFLAQPEFNQHYEAIAVFTIGTAICWTPQIGIIVVVWYLVFSK